RGGLGGGVVGVGVDGDVDAVVARREHLLARAAGGRAGLVGDVGGGPEVGLRTAGRDLEAAQVTGAADHLWAGGRDAVADAAAVPRQADRVGRIGEGGDGQ